MQIKIYLTINLADPDSEEWEESDEGNPEGAIEFLMSEFRYRLGHIPGGYIAEEEIKY